MSVICVADWSINDRLWTLGPSEGELLESQPGTAKGLAWLSGGRLTHQSKGPRFIAVYAEGESLWFQADAARWMFDGLEFKRSCDDRGVICRFQVLEDAREVLAFDYFGPLADSINQRDPSFDGLDEELLDFCLFLAVNGNRKAWRSNMHAKWAGES